MTLKKSNDEPKAKKAKTLEQEDTTTTTTAAASAAAHGGDKDDEDDNASSESDDDDDDDLILEGVLIRNPDVSDSDDSSEDDDDEDDVDDTKPAADKKRDSSVATTKTTMDKDTTTSNNSNKKKTKNRKRKKPAGGPDITQVDFTFWDMREHFFHGIKTLLHSSSTLYAAQSSALADLMIENVSVGTILSTEGDEEGNVFGFASVLNVSTYQEHDCIQYLKKICLDKCPAEHKMELQTVLSGSTKRPAGFLMHGRMINVPLEIVEILHQQLVLDMDWAVKNAEGGDEERKSLDFGAFVRIAPGTKDGTTADAEYKYFDDEIFANNAEFVFHIDAPKTFASDTKQVCTVIVMTKTGHREAMKELKRLVGS